MFHAARAEISSLIGLMDLRRMNPKFALEPMPETLPRPYVSGVLFDCSGAGSYALVANVCARSAGR